MLPIDQITTVERTPKNIATDSDDSPTHFENYDIDKINSSAPPKIEKSEFSEQTVKSNYAESSFCNHFLFQMVV